MLMAFGTAGLCLLFARNTQDAVANGDTRTLELFHAHTQETLRVTFRRNGSFDSSALEKLNWFLRDWRKDEPTSMSPGLFDIVWYAYRESGASEPIKIMSAYRSPGTNEMLRRRSRAVAKDSQHTRGNAMDFHIPGISMAKVREIAMRLQRGGVGYYPTAGSPFVHLDVGTVRSWPRMSRDQLTRVFPDGKTVHLPADGIPLENYQLALAEVQARGGNALDLDTINSNRGKSLWALLFGGDGDEDRVEEARTRVASRNTRGRGAQRPVEQVAALPFQSGDSVMQASIVPVQTAPALSARARRPLATETIARPAPEREEEPAAQKIEPKAPEPAALAVLQVASLPIPPIRPRGAQFEALVAASDPLPPIRPNELKAAPPVAIAALSAPIVPVTAEPAPVPISGIPLPPARVALTPSIEAPPVPEAPKAVAGVPLPPLRPAIAPQPAALALTSAQAVSAPAAALPGIVRAPEPTTSVQAYALVAAPQPPPRAVAPRLEPTPKTATHTALPRNPVPIRRASDADAKTDKRALTASAPAAEQRPDYVVQVSEPPVEREVKRSVIAMPLAQQPSAPSSLGFAGSFIRPLGARFTRLGE